MNNFRFFYSSFLILLCSVVHSNSFSATQPHRDFPSKVQFVENKKQWEDFIKYEAEFRGGKLFLEENRFTYVFYHPDDIQSLHAHEGKQIDKVRLHAVKINPINANSHPILSSYDTAAYFNNYFIGNDSSKWASDVHLFSSVIYNSLYPNIDMKFYSSLSDIKYDFILNPGANTNDIQLAFDGVDKLFLKNGNLVIHLSVGDIIEEKPYAYQIINNEKKEIACKFILIDNRLSFRFSGSYDKSIPVIIDPTLIFSSYTGSSADNWGFTATYDAAGDLYSGGNVNAVGYPTTAGAYQQTYNGGGFSGNGWSCDIAIAKFNPTGTRLLYATYLGGSDNEQPQSLVVDGNDNLLIFGTSYSYNYPTTTGCYDNTINGAGDIVISKLSPNGNRLLGSTFVGGSADDGLNTDPGFYTTGPLKYNYSDEARGEIISDNNNDYIIGSCTKSVNFPTTAGTAQSVYNGGLQDGVVFKINSSLTGMIWSTFIGGSKDDAVYDCVIDMNGDLYITGGTNSRNFFTTPGVLHSSYQGGVSDGFIAHLNSTATSILASTFIGTNSYDQTFFVELDFNGDVYCMGQTEGQYPVTSGVYSNLNGKQFIHKLNPALTTTIYSTVFGNGSVYPNISPTAFLVDTCENVYVAGWGRCLDFGSFTYGNVMGMPITANAFQSTTNGCDFYFFVLSRDALSLSYSTYFGGASSEEHVDGGTSRFDKNGVIYEAVCAGCGGRSDFPTTPGVVSRTNNSFNCNNGVIKLAFNLYKTVSKISTNSSAGCAPFTLTFNNNSINSVTYLWDFRDGTPQSNTPAPTHTFTSPGVYTVMLIAINNNSCNQIDTSYSVITVIAPVLLPATFTVNQNDPCDSFLVNTQFTGNQSLLYHWDFGDGFNTTAFNPSHLYGDSGTYQITLIVTDSACPSNTATISNTVHFLSPAVSADITPMNPASGCSPLSVSFTNNSSTSGNHFWDFRDGSNIDTSFNVNHTFTIPGIYNVMFVVSDTLSCNKADTAFVNVNVLPSVPVIPAFNSLAHQSCFNPSADFSFNGSGGNSYSWSFGDGNISTGPNATHIYPNAGDYLVTLTVNDTICGTSGTTSQVISFYPPISASVAVVGSNNGCPPLNVSFSNNSSTSGNHFWDFGDGSAIDTSFNANHTFTIPGNYNVMFVVSDTLSCNRGDTAFVNVNVLPSVPVIVSFNSILHPLCFNPSADFNFNGSGGNSYSWDFGDGTFSTGPNATHIYSNPGNYQVTLTVGDSVCGSNGTTSQVISFYPPVSASVAVLGSNSGCAPLNVSFSNNSSTSGNHFWDFGDGSAIDTSFNANHTFTILGTYNVMFVVSDTFSCNKADTAFINVNVLSFVPVIAAFNTILHPLCNNPSADFSFSGSGGISYSWDFGDGTFSTGPNVTHIYSNAGNYLVTLIVNDSICGTSGTTSQAISFYPPVSASVAVVGSNNGCAPLNVSFSNNSSTSGIHSWDFMDGSATDTSFNVNHTFTTPGIYNVRFIVSDSNSCNLSDTDFVRVIVYSSVPLQVSFNLITTPDCDSADASVNFNGTGGNIYLWNFGDGSVGTGSSNNHHYSQPGIFIITLLVNDSVCNQIDSVSKTLIIRPSVKAAINTDHVLFGCAPQTLHFSNLFNSIGDYYWDLGDSTFSLEHIVDHVYNYPGIYNIRLTVSDTASCNLTDKAVFNLKVYELPVADFTFVQNKQYYYSDVEFTDHSSINSLFYRWDLGDASVDTTRGSINHRYSNLGTYNVCLNVTTSEGCTDSTCADIIVENSQTIYIPSSFSPNGDAKNDVFKIYFNGLTELDVLIFDRWGEKIYEYKTLDGSWDGTYQGAPAPEDVYVYKLTAKGLLDDHIEKTGRVTLIY